MRSWRVIEMIFYHATKVDLPIGESLKTPTGKSCLDVKSGGVVYLADDIERCRRYGDVYEIEVSEAVSYKTQLKIQGLSKKPRYTKGVWIALPENTRILRRLKNDYKLNDT